MQVSYEPWLILLSVVIAIEGAYIGLRLALQIGATADMRRRLLLAGAAFALGIAVWAAHFVAMLATRLPFPVAYLVFPTLLSLLIGVLAIGVAVYAMSAAPFTLPRLTVASCLMGAAIVAMHSIGMTALQSSARMSDGLAPVALALLIAIAVCAVAVWLAAGRETRAPLLLPALAFGIAVSAVHFTALAGMTLERAPTALPTARALSADDLAIVVAVVTFCLSGVFLLLLVPDGVGVGAAAIDAALATPALANKSLADASVAAGASAIGSDADLRRGIYAPLGGAGAPPPRVADHLPIERDGATQFVPVEEVVAVQANAHYTYLFDGTAKLFCPLAIGEVESRLDRGRFMRVHRSHIVNIERVSGYKRSGDSEIVELGGNSSRYTVPVSRSRAGWLKSRIAGKSPTGRSSGHQ